MKISDNTYLKCLFALSISFFSLIAPINAWAYVDPGSGSVIVTTVLGLFAALGYIFRKTFYKLKRIFIRKKTNQKN